MQKFLDNNITNKYVKICYNLQKGGINMNSIKAFYAYPSNDPDLLEDIKGAVKIINSSKSVEITTWEDLAIGGKNIIDGILNTIDNCELFICDLTYLNFNVLYELGYAIAKQKKSGLHSIKLTKVQLIIIRVLNQ